MKKLYPLSFVLFFIYWGCDDPKEENKPTPVTLSSIDNLIKWTMNEDTDFFRYSLYGSNNSSIEDKTLIYETQTRLDTTYTLDSNEYYSSYQVDVMNLNESVSSSNILKVFVYLWGEYYSIENTTVLPDLGYYQLTGEIPSEIGDLINLTELLLYENQFTGDIPTEIWNLTNLTHLNLNNNQLTGSIPPEIGNLTNLEQLSLSDNQLTGSIPPEIGNLTNLTKLYLNVNQLTGSIPLEIGNLTNLLYLRLSYNQLTGEIPESICGLNIDWMNLYYFGTGIYYNQLCPPYPSCIEDYVGEQDTSNCD